MADRHLHLEDLHLHDDAGRALLRSVSLEMTGGQLTALVGASGSGKTLTVRALLGLSGLTVAQGRLTVREGERVSRPYDALPDRAAVERAFVALRGASLGWIPQDGRAALDPLREVGAQLSAVARRAGQDGPPTRWLERAGQRDAARVSRLYPHELSGGMAQRVNVALALARGARFLLADEPTTGLDPTVQEAVLQTLRALVDSEGVAVLLVTHDLRLVPRLADKLLVMHAGEIVAEGPGQSLDKLSHPAAVALRDATARVAGGFS
ncbi:ATP-binding cassette domain-containing protein [Myxococcota bacterium]|nr:ATP-binding cassette domain-containing protein [Myxococcota bacterium]